MVTRSVYDGQMPVFERQFNNGIQQWKRYNALGARGIDGWYNTASSSWHYPIYDVHGNVKATLTRSGGTGHATANWKSFDVWGGERASEGSASMFGYCGNLGHPTDPESGLIYMRARFYEPWTGRFLSQDKANQGPNWFIYCGNSPATYIDESGNIYQYNRQISAMLGLIGMANILMAFLVISMPFDSPVHILWAVKQASFGIACVALAEIWSGAAFDFTVATIGFFMASHVGNLVRQSIAALSNLIAANVISVDQTSRSHASTAVMACAIYSCVVMAHLIASMHATDN